MTPEPEAQPAEPTEPAAEPSRIAGGCVALILIGVAGAVTYAVPETGYYVAGLLTAAGVRKARAWTGRRHAAADEEQPEPEPVDIGEHLRALGEGGHHVLLTGLRESTGLPDTKAVRQLLEEAGIRVRGVRAPAGNGPGVHMADIPGAPSPDGAPLSDRCLCSSGANANANNSPESGPREGFRVEAIGQAGTVVHDPTEAHRHQTVRTH